LPVAQAQAVRAAFKARSQSLLAQGGTEPSEPAAGLGRRSADAASYPLNAMGKLFFRAENDPPDQVHLCAAEFVAHNIILTSAHCVQQGAPPYSYYKDFVFAAQYQHGSAKYVYRWKCLANPRGWAQESAARHLHDFALIQVDAPSQVGWLGLQWNWTNQSARITEVGYDGDVAAAHAGRLSVTPDGFVAFSPDDRARNLTLAGAWVRDFSAASGGSANRIIGLPSFSAGDGSGSSGMTYGLTFTDETATVLNYVKGGC
jgi:hypothetical protein